MRGMSTNRLLRIGIAAVSLNLVVCVMPGQTQRPASADIRVLLRQMTLDEKISLVHGARDPEDLGQAGYWPGLPRLGIPLMRFADGPSGVNVNQDATAMPAPVGLAAAFSERAARLYGIVMGREARALRQDVLLAPHMNIVRDPLFRRNHTTLSEDPLLTARLAAAEITGIQSQGMMAQVKHLAGYNGSDDVVIDERTLHEIYLPAFEASVRAGVASVMCSYNRINGQRACESSELQNDVLRGAWGFEGFITSDWGAIRTPLAISKGVDLEMPGRELAGRRGGPYFADALKSSIASGSVPVAALDNAVTRILSQMARFQMLDRSGPARPDTIDIETDANIVLGIAEQGAVLLKNEGGLLPLEYADLASLAVIGPTAGQLAAGFMGERGYGFERRLIAPLEALRKSAPGANVRYSIAVDLTGVPIPASALSLDGRRGLDLDFAGQRTLAPRTEHTWNGTLTVCGGGDYTFMVQPALGNGSEGGGTIAVDGRIVSRTGGPGFGGTGIAPKKWSSLLPTTDGRDNGRGSISLAAGPHRIEVTAHSTGDAPLAIRFSWITPESRRADIDAAVATAKAVRTPVVFAWSGASAAFLPEGQDELIARVAAANSRTIVVLNAGGPVAMPWKNSVRAILAMWYPGQEGGWATANLLLGRANPAGKLPVTFPVRLEDAPARAAGHPERVPQGGPPVAAASGGDAPVVTFSEGIAVGYRWYDQQNIEPLFPFGHGLSYTRFEYAGLSVKRASSGIDVTFTLRNVGSRKGADVPQVYLGPVEHAPISMVPKSLAGFERIELEPGQSRTVTMHVGARDLSYWSTVEHGWVVAHGTRPVYVGASSRDIRLMGELR
jgi:beta-glucosidase